MSPQVPHPSPLASLGRPTALAIAFALIGGCVVDEDPMSEAETNDAIHDSESALEEHQIERDGTIFERLGPVVEHPVEPGPDAIIRPRLAIPESAFEPRPLTEWSRDELADKLRPVIATGDDTLYIAQDPAWEAADAILEGDVAPLSVDIRPRVDEGRPIVEPVDDALAPRAVIGADGRWRVANTTAAPHNAIVKLQLYTGNTYRGSCSGSYIGPWTLITSAHCIVFSNTDRVNRIVFEPARNGGALPYGSFDCRLDDANTSNDYLWSVPAGYLNGQADELDYAVMDTWPCHSAPRWFGGYRANAGDASYSTYGYPGDRCPGAPGPGNYQCGMTGSAYVNEWRLESEHIDSIGGQSGSPWYRRYDVDRPVGVLWGYREYFDLFRCGFDVCRRNFARRIDTAFSDFIVDVAWDF